MNLNILQEIGVHIKNEFLDKFIEKLEIHLDNKNINNQLFSLDRFEGNFAVLENCNSQEMLSIDISKLPINVKEGDILKLENGTYIIDEDATKNMNNSIRNKIEHTFCK